MLGLPEDGLPPPRARLTVPERSDVDAGAEVSASTRLQMRSGSVSPVLATAMILVTIISVMGSPASQLSPNSRQTFLNAERNASIC
jgi:hypothetical protein